MFLLGAMRLMCSRKGLSPMPSMGRAFVRVRSVAPLWITVTGEPSRGNWLAMSFATCRVIATTAALPLSRRAMRSR